jgi:PPOX class probable F420-dependent enzyme|tara:strand:- start:3936 stop:4328 length:393 start_codon:yes stop_codon:yes gene_type:complete
MTLLPEFVLKLAQGKNLAFSASLNPNGSPHLTPTWVDTDGEHIIINTTVGKKKHRNVKRDPRVAVTIAEGANIAIIHGRVEEQIEGELAKTHVDKLSQKYLGVDTFPYLKPGDVRVILKIAAEKVIIQQR